MSDRDDAYDLDPAATDPELALLGLVMLVPETLDEIGDALTAADFGSTKHALLFAAMGAVSRAGVALNIHSLAAQLDVNAALEKAGGLAYLSTLDAYVPTHGNADLFVGLVRDQATTRALKTAGARIVGLASEALTAAEKLDRAEQVLATVTQRRAAADTAEFIGPIVRRVYDQAIARSESPDEHPVGIRTHFRDFDDLTAGLHPGELTILAARSGLGKTTLALQMALNIATPDEDPVLVFELEMERDSIAQRLLAATGGVDSHAIRVGKLQAADFGGMARAAEKIHRASLIIDDANAPTLLDLRSRARRVRAKHGLRMLVVDYLQLIKGAGDGRNREQEVAQISRGLKGLARELNVPVLALAQLNRENERRADKRPQMSDLRESGALEHDADNIVFIYRDDVYNKNSSDKGIAEIIVAKQRNGPCGTVRLGFEGKFTRFSNEEDAMWRRQ